MRIFHPNADSDRDLKFHQIYSSNENEKKALYFRRVALWTLSKELSQTVMKLMLINDKNILNDNDINQYFKRRPPIT